jgi:hypothetical protein
MGGRRGRDHMVVGFTTTYATSVYHHYAVRFPEIIVIFHSLFDGNKKKIIL